MYPSYPSLLQGIQIRQLKMISHTARQGQGEKAQQRCRDGATARPNKLQHLGNVARCSWDSAASLEQRLTCPFIPLPLPLNCSIAVCLFFKALVSFKRSCSWSWLISCWIKILSSWQQPPRASFCLGPPCRKAARPRKTRAASGLLGSSLCHVLSAISSLSLTIFSFLSTLCSLLSTFVCQAAGAAAGTGQRQRQPASLLGPHV